MSPCGNASVMRGGKRSRSTAARPGGPPDDHTGHGRLQPRQGGDVAGGAPPEASTGTPADVAAAESASRSGPARAPSRSASVYTSRTPNRRDALERLSTGGPPPVPGATLARPGRQARRPPGRRAWPRRVRRRPARGGRGPRTAGQPRPSTCRPFGQPPPASTRTPGAATSGIWRSSTLHRSPHRDRPRAPTAPPHHATADEVERIESGAGPRPVSAGPGDPPPAGRSPG